MAPDLVQRRFNPDTPDQLWCGNTTYIATDEGWVYLAAVIDLFSRQVVGWSMQPHMQTSLVKDALLMACWRRRPAKGLIFHSDRGSQYCSHEFQTTMKAWGISSSMSRKGNCWDNAVMERFFLSLKMERVWQRDYANHAEAKADIADYIVGFYNPIRLHSTLGYQSPNSYEMHQAFAAHSA